MPETQIRIEIKAYLGLFPFYLRLISKKLKIEISSIKKYRQFFLLNTTSQADEIYYLIENLYNFGNFFNIQSIKFDYKPLAK